MATSHVYFEDHNAFPDRIGQSCDCCIAESVEPHIHREEDCVTMQCLRDGNCATVIQACITQGQMLETRVIPDGTAPCLKVRRSLTKIIAIKY
jgi:hypothetical protein